MVSKRSFFRTNKNNNNDKEIKDFRKDEIAKFLIKNYLRYRNSEFDEISNLLNIVLDNMQKNNILIVDNEIIKIIQNLIENNALNVSISIIYL